MSKRPTIAYRNSDEAVAGADHTRNLPTMKAMVSSTALDLPEHRQAALDACVLCGVLPIGMERKPPSDQDGMAISLEMVDEVDIYIGIYAFRYGWIPECSKISITEIEFNRALERKSEKAISDILVFTMADDHLVRPGDVEANERARFKLQKFKRRASEGRQRALFSSTEELKRKIVHALGDIRERRARMAAPSAAGTFRPSTELAARVDDLVEELATKAFAGRGDALTELDQFVTERPCGFLLVTGDAGNGKSALLAHWIRKRSEKPRVIRHLFSYRSDLTRSVVEFYRAIFPR